MKEFYIDCDGIRLHAKLERPEGAERGPLCILVHGFTGHMEEDHIIAASQAVLEAGVSVLRVEMYGHGQSDGTFREHTLYKWLTNALCVIHYARSLDFVTDLYFMGHSQGGFLTMMIGGMCPDLLKAVIPLSPAWRIPEQARKGELLGQSFDPKNVPDQIRSDDWVLNGDYIRAAQTLDERSLFQRTGIPVCIIHGHEDELIAYQHAELAVQLYRNAELVPVFGADHCFTGHTEELKAAIRSFFEAETDQDNTHRFDGVGNYYRSGRPGYSEELLKMLYEDHGLAKAKAVADIGSGTGIFTGQMILRGSTVYAVEPNDDMRRVAEEELGGSSYFHSVKGDASDTNLPDHSVNAVTAAQAFHWFDVEAFRKECSRILTKDGKVFLIWNVRDMEDPLNVELYRLYKRYCPEFKGFAGGLRMEEDDPRIRRFFRDQYMTVCHEHPLTLDRERFIARSLSGSYSLKEGDQNYDAYMAELLKIYERYEKNGHVVLSNQAVAYIGTVD